MFDFQGHERPFTVHQPLYVDAVPAACALSDQDTCVSEAQVASWGTRLWLPWHLPHADALDSSHALRGE